MWWMWALGVATVVLPLVLLVAFNGSEVADSRGRRLQQRWRVRPGRVAAAKREGSQEP